VDRRELQKAAELNGQTPLEFLLEVMRKPGEDLALRLDAAKTAAPYLHARKAPETKDGKHWRDYILFYEYFHGDNGAGLGASHQTGWTGLVAKQIQALAVLQSREVLEGDTIPG
jgi:hypothetical protein